MIKTITAIVIMVSILGLVIFFGVKKLLEKKLNYLLSKKKIKR